MKKCVQCLKERDNFRTIKSGYTYTYCGYCEALNKRFYALHRAQRFSAEYYKILEAMRKLENAGGKLIKNIHNVLHGKSTDTVSELIRSVTSDD